MRTAKLTVTGALALFDFDEMLRLRYEMSVSLQLERFPAPPHSKAFTEVLAAMQAERLPLPKG